MTAVVALSAVLLLLVEAGLLVAPFTREQRYRLRWEADHGRDRADWLGFNSPVRSRRRSPDFQYVTRAPADTTPHVFDQV